jgi:hypothetical protein
MQLHAGTVIKTCKRTLIERLLIRGHLAEVESDKRGLSPPASHMEPTAAQPWAVAGWSSSHGDS